MSISVEVRPQGEEGDWSMRINVSQFHGTIPFVFEFYISEPYLNTLENWKRIAKGGTALYLYGISLDDGYYHLYVDTEAVGQGNDMSSSMKIKEACLSPQLVEAIDKAIELKLDFANETT